MNPTDNRQLATSFFAWSLLTVMITAYGCGNSPSRVRPPKIATDAGAAAIRQFDSDGNGTLSKDELKQAPCFSLARLDENQDGAISAEEISSRINKWDATNVGMMSYDVTLVLDGQPLEGATVSIEPMDFLGNAVLPASGTSGEDGLAVLSVAKQHQPAPNLEVVHCGFYKIRVSKRNGDQELLPQKFNADTELGCEIAPDTRSEINEIRLRTK